MRFLYDSISAKKWAELNQVPNLELFISIVAKYDVLVFKNVADSVGKIDASRPLLFVFENKLCYQPVDNVSEFMDFMKNIRHTRVPEIKKNVIPISCPIKKRHIKKTENLKTWLADNPPLFENNYAEYNRSYKFFSGDKISDITFRRHAKEFYTIGNTRAKLPSRPIQGMSMLKIR